MAQVICLSFVGFCIANPVIEFHVPHECFQAFTWHVTFTFTMVLAAAVCYRPFMC